MRKACERILSERGRAGNAMIAAAVLVVPVLLAWHIAGREAFGMEGPAWYEFQRNVHDAAISYFNGDYERARALLEEALANHPDAESAFEVVAEADRSTFESMMLSDRELAPLAAGLLDLSARWEMHLLNDASDPSALEELAGSFAQTRNRVFLGRMRAIGVAVVPAIISCLESAITEGEKVNLVSALQGFGTDAVSPLCYALVGDGAASRRSLSGDEQDVGRTASEGVRLHLAWVLGQLGDIRAWPVLEAVAQDAFQPQLVRQAAALQADRLEMMITGSPSNYLEGFWPQVLPATTHGKQSYVWQWRGGALYPIAAPEGICALTELEFVCDKGVFPSEPGWADSRQAYHAAAVIALKQEYDRLASAGERKTQVNPWPSGLLKARLATLSAGWSAVVEDDIGARLRGVAERKARAYDEKARFLGRQAVHAAFKVAVSRHDDDLTSATLKVLGEVGRRSGLEQNRVVLGALNSESQLIKLAAAECVASLVCSLDLVPPDTHQAAADALEFLAGAVFHPYLDGETTVVVGPEAFCRDAAVVLTAAGASVECHDGVTPELRERIAADPPEALLVADVNTDILEVLQGLCKSDRTILLQSGGEPLDGWRWIPGETPRDVARNVVRELAEAPSPWLPAAKRAATALLGIDGSIQSLVSELISPGLVNALLVGGDDLRHQHLLLAGRFGSQVLVGPLVTAASEAADKGAKLDALVALQSVIPRARASLTNGQLDALLVLANTDSAEIRKDVATILGATELSPEQRQRALEAFQP